MSPTAAILIRSVLLSGPGGGAGAGGGATSGGCASGWGMVSSGGATVQAATCSDNNKKSAVRLVSDADTKYIDLCGAQPAAQQGECLEVGGRSDVDAMVIASVYLDSLYMRFNSL